MSEEIRCIARFKIKPGQLEAFRKVAASCLENTKNLDTGTLQYDLHLDSEGSEAICLERYTNSQAMIEHIDHVGAENIEGLGATSEVSVELFGSPSQTLIDRLGGPGVPVFAFVAGL